MTEEKLKQIGKKTKAVGLNKAISTKDAIEISRFLRCRRLEQAKRLLENVILKKVAVPMRSFNKDTGHRPGIGPGRYPLKAAKEFLYLINSAEANARFKGLDLGKLHVTIIVNQGSRNFKSGRQRRRTSKSTHLEVILEERK